MSHLPKMKKSGNGFILMGDLPKRSHSLYWFGSVKAFLDSIEVFLIKFFFTYYVMIWLDDLHASLPGLNHRSPFVFVISLAWWGLHLFEMCSLNRLTTSLLEFSLYRSCSELFAVLLKPNPLWPTYLLDIFYFTCYLICHHYLTRVKSFFVNEITPLFHYLKHFFS